MADRETINRNLRQKVHDELDKALILLGKISDLSLRTTAQKSYDDIYCWVKDRTKRVKSDSLKQLFVATNILIEKINSHLGITNGSKEETRPEKYEKEGTHNLNVPFVHQVNLDQQAGVKNCSGNTTIPIEIPSSCQELAKDWMDEEIIQMASAYDSSHFGTSKTIEAVEESRERIALKYPRKKIDSDFFKKPDAPRNRPSSPLFLRRHEVLPPKQTAATYAEHKRQMHAKKIWETRTEAAVVPPRPSPLDPRIEFYKRTHDKTDPRNEETPSQPLTKHGPNNNATQSIQGNLEKTNQKNVQHSEKSINEICTPHEVAESLELPETLLSSVTKTVENVLPKTGKLVNGNGTNVHTSNKSASNDIPDVPSGMSKCRKSRELHRLLSDATEFLEKSSKREQSNKADQQRTDASTILEEFGITHDIRVVLEKTDIDGNASKKTNLRRRNSICFGTLNSSSEYNFKFLDKPSKVSNKTSKKNTSTHTKAVEESKPASKVGKKASEIVANIEVAKPVCKGVKKTSGIVSNDKGPLNDGSSTLKEPCKTAAKPGTSKTNSKRKVQATQDPAPKKQRCETLERYDKSVLNETERPTTALQPPEPVSIEGAMPSEFNNSPKMHCNSKYITSCCLCDYQVEHQTKMVQHYVYEHPASEPFVSRVTPECATTIKQNPFNVVGKRVISRHGPRTISFSCLFCEKRNTLRKKDWVDHLVGHTGEYRFRCRACPAMARRLDEQVKHDDLCGDPEMIVCNDISFDENHLYGYMCEMCNFVQIRRFNMDRHLQREHPGKEPSCIKFSLVNYDIDSESQSFHGLVKCEPKSEEKWLCDSDIIVKDEKILNATEELEALDSVVIYPICIEKQELILPDHCDDSNDSQCTLPMTSNDEDIWNILDVEEDQICARQKELSVVKNENFYTERGNVSNSQSENAQMLVQNVCDNSAVNNQWQLFTNSNITHKIVLKRTNNQNQNVVNPALEEACLKRAGTMESNEGAPITPDVPTIRILKLPGDKLSR